MILGVNVDHVATLRQARLGHDPDPVMAATLAILGGADGITVHLREDRRHIADRDLVVLREVVRVELNLEMAATEEMQDIALRTKPDLVTIVPEKRAELTTEGGLNLRQGTNAMRDCVKRLRDGGIQVSLFINPDPGDVSLSREIGADMVEIHTGRYANSRDKKAREELEQVRAAVDRAGTEGLAANAGHGLNYQNVKPVAALGRIRGLYIGHSIVSRAVFSGLEIAVREMKALIETAG